MAANVKKPVTAQQTAASPTFGGSAPFVPAHPNNQSVDPMAPVASPETGQPTGTPTSPSSQIAGLTTGQRNAYTAVEQLFDSYGLSSLASTILNYVKQGYDSTTTTYLLQQSDAYKQRFAGNTQRIANGLAPLSPAEYLATERAYKDAAQAYGLPSGFYDNPSDFAGLIGSDISPTEFQTRASYAFQYAQSGNQTARTALQQYYGIDDSHMAAYFLDPTKAQSVIDRQVQAANIGGAAAQQGLSVGKSQAEGYVDQGVTQSQAQSGFQNAATVLQGGESNLGQRFGQQYTAQDAEDEFVGGLASAARKRQQLNQSETDLFAGTAGSAARSFGTDNFGSY